MGAQGPPVQADLPNLSPGNPSDSHLLRSCLISNLQPHPPDCLCPFGISTNSRSLHLGKKKKCAPGEGGNRTGMFQNLMNRLWRVNIPTNHFPRNITLVVLRIGYSLTAVFYQKTCQCSEIIKMCLTWLPRWTLLRFVCMCVFSSFAFLCSWRQRTFPFLLGNVPVQGLAVGICGRFSRSQKIT